MMKPLRIAFMGTPDFAVPALKALNETEHEIVCVYTQPPRPKGRGHKVQLSPVHVYAQSQNIPVFNPLNFKSDEAIKEFQSHNLDIAIVAAYGLILPEPVLNAPRFGCLNIHASCLPRWRGASPIQRAIWEGDHETGITIMQMDKGLDTGDMITARTIPITPETTTVSLHDALSEIGGALIVKSVHALSCGKTLNKEKQNNAQTTYAPLLKKEDGRIDWSQTAQQIDRQMRALNPWPGTWCALSGERIKILSAKLTNQTSNEKSGTLLDKQGSIVCGEQTILQIKTLQPSDKKAMDFASALNGGYIKISDRLS